MKKFATLLFSFLFFIPCHAIALDCGEYQYANNGTCVYCPDGWIYDLNAMTASFPIPCSQCAAHQFADRSTNKCYNCEFASSGFVANEGVNVDSLRGLPTSNNTCPYMFACQDSNKYPKVEKLTSAATLTVSCASCPTYKKYLYGTRNPQYKKKMYYGGSKSTDDQIFVEDPCDLDTTRAPLELTDNLGFLKLYAVKNDDYQWCFSTVNSQNYTDYQSACVTQVASYGYYNVSMNIPNKVVSDLSNQYITGWKLKRDDSVNYINITVNGKNCGKESTGTCAIKIEVHNTWSPSDEAPIILDMSTAADAYNVLLFANYDELITERNGNTYIPVPKMVQNNWWYAYQNADTRTDQMVGIVCAFDMDDNAGYWPYTSDEKGYSCNRNGYEGLFFGNSKDKLWKKSNTAGYYEKHDYCTNGAFFYSGPNRITSERCTVQPKFIVARIRGGNIPGFDQQNYVAMEIENFTLDGTTCKDYLDHFYDTPMDAVNRFKEKNPNKSISKISVDYTKDRYPAHLPTEEYKYIVVGVFQYTKCRPGCYCTGLGSATTCPDAFTSDEGSYEKKQCYIKPNVRIKSTEDGDVTDFIKSQGLDLSQKLYLFQ